MALGGNVQLWAAAECAPRRSISSSFNWCQIPAASCKRFRPQSSTWLNDATWCCNKALQEIFYRVSLSAMPTLTLQYVPHRPFSDDFARECFLCELCKEPQWYSARQRCTRARSDHATVNAWTWRRAATCLMSRCHWEILQHCRAHLLYAGTCTDTCKWATASSTAVHWHRAMPASANVFVKSYF